MQVSGDNTWRRGRGGGDGGPWRLCQGGGSEQLLSRYIHPPCTVICNIFLIIFFFLFLKFLKLNLWASLCRKNYAQSLRRFSQLQRAHWWAEFKRRGLWAWFVTSHMFWKPVFSWSKRVSWEFAASRSQTHTLRTDFTEVQMMNLWNEDFLHVHILEFLMRRGSRSHFKNFNVVIILTLFHICHYFRHTFSRNL